MIKVPEIRIDVTLQPGNKEFILTNSEEVQDILRLLFHKETLLWTEEMILLCLNKANKLIGFYKLSSGGVSGTVADPRVIFTIALKSGASNIIISHNHPSGNLKPSEADIRMTKKISEAGNLLDIKLLDHIIITSELYYSLADNGDF